MTTIRYQTQIEGCGDCPMYSFEEGFYHHCNHYDEYFNVKGVGPEKTERPNFCNIKEIVIMEEK